MFVCPSSSSISFFFFLRFTPRDLRMFFEDGCLPGKFRALQPESPRNFGKNAVWGGLNDV